MTDELGASGFARLITANVCFIMRCSIILGKYILWTSLHNKFSKYFRLWAYSVNSLETTRSDSITGRWEENSRPIYYGTRCEPDMCRKGGSVFLTPLVLRALALKASSRREPVWETQRGKYFTLCIRHKADYCSRGSSRESEYQPGHHKHKR